jgi:phosphopantothenoylcysteine decarboxylase/phosphopantothenate--cysteine ligase
MELQRTRSRRLEGKRIALGVTGSIAAIETPKLARELIRHGAEVRAYMTHSARRILHPCALEFATQREVVVELTGKVEHLEAYDLVVVAPATANTIAKIAYGMADSPVTDLVLSTGGKVLVSPAMDGRMYGNPRVQENLARLREGGILLVDPLLEEGKAKLPLIERLVDACLSALTPKDFEGIRVAVTAGPTMEYLDPIRVLTNKSSGKMGIAIAKEAHFRGAEVRLIYGFGTETPPPYLDVRRVETTEEMLREVQEAVGEGFRLLVMAAAVADFSAEGFPEKIDSRKGPVPITLRPTPKILEAVKGSGIYRVGFKAVHNVSQDALLEQAREALERYELDLVVANDVSKGVFRSETDEVLFLTKEGESIPVPRTMKAEIARLLLDRIAKEI